MEGWELDNEDKGVGFPQFRGGGGYGECGYASAFCIEMLKTWNCKVLYVSG